MVPDGRRSSGPSRRRLLGTIGAGASGASVAGCSARRGVPEPTSPTDDDATPSAVRTPSGSDGAAVQRAIDSAAANVTDGGYAFVEGNHDTVYEVEETITLPSNVYLRNFHFELADGAQTTVIESARFDELEGSNTWAGDNGVPYNFGLVNVHIDGNKHENGGRPDTEEDRGEGLWFNTEPQDPDRSGRGVAFYGKRWWVDNVVIRKCPRTGFYSEGAAKGGQPSGWTDLPESQIGNLWVRNCDGHGIVYRGPHDGQATMLIGVLNDGHGFACERDTGGFKSGVYSGAGFVCSRLHTYSNAEPQLLADGFGVFWNYVDNEQSCIIDHQDFFVHHLHCGGGRYPSALRIEQGARIHTLTMHGRGGDVDGLVIDGHRTSIGEAAVNGYQGNGVLVNGVQSRIGRLRTTGGDGDGLRIDGQSAYVGDVRVRGFSRDGVAVTGNNVRIDRASAVDNGRYGVRLGTEDGEINESRVAIRGINGNDEAGFRYGGGDRNVVRLYGYVVGGSTGYDTSGAMPNSRDDFTIHLDGPGAGVGLSEQHGQTTLSGDGSTRTFTIEHDLLAAPTSVDATAVGGATPPIDRVRNLTAESIDVEFREAPASGASATVSWTASMAGL
jgi:hypothetical protein